MGSYEQWEFQSFFRSHWKSLAQPKSQENCLGFRLCKETMKESILLLGIYQCSVTPPTTTVSVTDRGPLCWQTDMSRYLHDKWHIIQFTLNIPWLVRFKENDVIMMRSWHGETFHITDPLWGNPPDPVNWPDKGTAMQRFDIFSAVSLNMLLTSWTISDMRRFNTYEA